MQKLLCRAAALAGALLLVGAAAAGAAEYVVVYQHGASLGAAREAVHDAGGTIVSENKDVGVATVRSTDPAFAKKADAERALYGTTAASSAIGRAPNDDATPAWRDVERERGTPNGGGGRHAPPVNGAHGGLTLDPDKVERILRKTATDTPCPAQEPFTYPDNPPGVPPAFCDGTPAFNGFYGDGIVNALAASKAG